MSIELDRKAIARRVFAVRSDRKLAQAAVATLAGCTQRSVAEIEKGGSFSSRLLRDVAIALAVGEDWLLTGHGDKNAVGVLSNARYENLTKFRQVPVVSWATAGAAKDYNDLANFLDEKVISECKDPNAFCIIVDGDSMQPDIRPGDRVVVSPNTEAQSGDLVIARTRKDHAVYFKKFLRHGPGGEKVRLLSLNPSYPPMEFKITDFRFIYPVVNLVRIYRRTA